VEASGGVAVPNPGAAEDGAQAGARSAATRTLEGNRVDMPFLTASAVDGAARIVALSSTLRVVVLAR